MFDPYLHENEASHSRKRFLGAFLKLRAELKDILESLLGYKIVKLAIVKGEFFSLRIQNLIYIKL